VLIRTRCSEIREMGRSTQGVTLISLEDGQKLSGLQRIVDPESEADAEGTDGAEGDSGQDSSGDDAPKE
jgi:DNA gyrase subunit A